MKITEEERSHMMMREKIKGLQNKFFSNLLYGGIKKEEYKSFSVKYAWIENLMLLLINITNINIIIFHS